MRTALFVLMLLITVGLIRFIKGDLSFPFARILPFCDGPITDPMHPIGSIILIIMLVYAIRKILSQNKDS